MLITVPKEAILPAISVPTSKKYWLAFTLLSGRVAPLVIPVKLYTVLSEVFTTLNSCPAIAATASAPEPEAAAVPVDVVVLLIVVDVAAVNDPVYYPRN